MKNEDYTPMILWSSEEKNPAGDPYITVKKARDYYYYTERGGVDSIAFILYDSKNGKFGLINESKPPLDHLFNERHMMTTAFGGSIDSNLTRELICRAEVLEEAGYDVDVSKIRCVGSTLVSSQMNQFCVGYLVDVTGLIPGKTEADIINSDLVDPLEFVNDKTVWMNATELLENNDWKSIWIFAKMKMSELI